MYPLKNTVIHDEETDKAQGVAVDIEKILVNLYEKHKNKSWVLSGDEAMQKANGFFSGKWRHLAKKDTRYLGPPRFALESGVVVFKNDSLFFMGNERRV